MPVYEYFCKDCDDKFEVRASVSQMVQVLECPEGHASARKVLSAFAVVNSSPRVGFDASACCGAESMSCGAESCCSI